MAARPARVPTPTDATDGQLLLAQIRHMGRSLDDLENLRVRHTNRRKALEREYGAGIVLPPDEILLQLQATEKGAAQELIRLWRQTSLAPFAKAFPAVGEKSMARLYAEIGDPADRPNVAKLWAYCGVGNPNLIRVPKNATQEEVMRRGNRRARSLLHMIGEAMKQHRCAACTMAERARRDPDKPKLGAPWAPPPADCFCAKRPWVGRLRYDARRIVTIDRDDMAAGRKDRDALRITEKLFLRDLWVAARALREEAE